MDVDLDGNGDASGEQLNDATLLTIALDQLNLSIGAAGAGLAVTSGRLGIAILTAPKTATDNRSWLALSASNLGITLSIPGITATVTNGSVLLNRASGAKDTVANTTELNWVTTDGGNQNGLIDFNSAGAYTANLSQLVDPGAALSPPVAMPVTVRGEQMAVSGTLTNLNVFDVITGSANFALVTQQVDVDLDGIAGGETLNDATLLTLGLTSLNLSVGAGGDGPGDHRRQGRHRDDQGSAADDRGRHRHPQLDGDHGQGPHDLADPARRRHLGQRQQRHAEDQQGGRPVPGADAARRDRSGAGARHCAARGPRPPRPPSRWPSTSTRPAAGRRRAPRSSSTRVRRCRRPTRCRSSSTATSSPWPAR